MGRVIAVAIQKGGVGKTTTVMNLATALALEGHRVALIDLDPQASATTGMGIPAGPPGSSIYDVLVSARPITEVIRRTTIETLDVIPASRDLVGSEIELVPMPAREHRLDVALESIRDRYAYLLIDCPPSLGLLTVNGLRAANSVLVPLQAEYYALEGLTALLDTIARVRQTINPTLALEGLLVTMFDGRNSLARQVQAEVQKHFGDQVFRTIIPRNVRLSEAPSHGLSVLTYSPSSPGALAYRALAAEIAGRVRIENRTEVLFAPIGVRGGEDAEGIGPGTRGAAPGSQRGLDRADDGTPERDRSEP